MIHWEERFLDFFNHVDQSDGSHDLGHFRRVAAMAKTLAKLESGPVDEGVILAAAYFHDIVNLPKNHPEAHLSSRFAAEKAKEILSRMNFPRDKISAVCHAIEAHSFTGHISPQTLEAKIIQDADRMEALGALGILRAFYVAGRIGSLPYDPQDVLAEKRPLDEKLFALDHFYVKLFKIPDLMQTTSAKMIAGKRAEFLQLFVNKLIAKEPAALCVVYAAFEGGKRDQKLFHSQDPFAQKREVEPNTYVIDELLQYAFNSYFLDQLKSELIL